MEFNSHEPFSQGRMSYNWSVDQLKSPRKEGQGLLGGDPRRRPNSHQVPDWGCNQPFIRSLLKDGPNSANRSSFREFLESHPVIETEIGVGRGDFLLSRAAQLPARGFVGFEVQTGRAAKLVRRVSEAQLANIWISDDDARFGIPFLLANRQVTAVHVLFPDPWWKPNHLNRRLVTPSFINTLGNILRPGGLLHLRSDVADLMESARIMLAGTSLFLPPDSRLQELLEPYQATHRERWCMSRGFPVHSLLCVRTKTAGN